MLIESDYHPLLEIRWENRKHLANKSSTETVFREISKKKNSACTKTQLPTPFAEFAKTSHAIGFRWEEGDGDLGIVWQCGQCSAILFCHLHEHPAFSLKKMAQILMSISCCGERDGYTEWSLQDFSLRIPADFLIDNSYFGAGLTKLTFHDGVTILHICRLAPASAKLAEKTVREILSTLNDRFTSKESSCQENEKTLECWTNPSLISQLHHRLRRKKAFCLGCIRHDDINNRLLAVIAESNRPIAVELPREILDNYEIIQ